MNEELNQDKMKEIGNRLKQVRETLGFNQKNFSEPIDVSSSFISQIEHGNKSNPGVAIFLKIAIFYKISLDYLFQGVGDMLLTGKDDNRKDNRKYIGEIETENDLLWLMERSKFFKDSIMGYAGKFKIENDDLIKKSIERYHKKYNDKEDSDDFNKQSV
jgi:transcriptional regulator with XRE-family HTH domain